MTGVNSKDLTPAFFRHIAAQLAAFKASEERNRRYVYLRLTRRTGLAERSYWLTDEGLALVDRLEVKR